MAKVLVFGGRGFIGEYVLKELEGESALSIESSTPGPEVKTAIRDAKRILWLVRPQVGLLASYRNDLRKASGLERFVYASTSLLYRDSSAPQDETALIEPSNPYERAKAEEENLLKDIFIDNPSKLIIARLGNVYGDVKNTGVIGKIFTALQQKKVFIITDDGSQKRDYIFVEDVAKILKQLLFSPNIQGIYNVAAGESYSLIEVIGKIENIAKATLQIQYRPAEKEKHAIRCNIEKIWRELRARPQVELDIGLERAYKQYA